MTTEDPLGAYCVDYIKHEYTRVVSYYQATLDIHYRRTQEQVRSMVRVTGTGAIRTELRQALTRFAGEVVLRVAYFSEDQESIAQLIRQTYYDTPSAALGCPQAEISLYPDSGRERVVEILLTYPESAEELRRKGEALGRKQAELARQEPAGPASSTLESPAELARRSVDRLWAEAVYAPDGGPTAYDALVAGVADDEGMALAYALTAGGKVVEGELRGEPHFWINLGLTGEELYLDPSEGTGNLYTAQTLFEAGYRWEGGPEEPAREEETGEGQKEGENGLESQ